MEVTLLLQSNSEEIERISFVQQLVLQTAVKFLVVLWTKPSRL
jgi:hypothetical protein